MTNSRLSDSSSGASESFSRLHPKLQAWVYEQGWTSLHDAQERAIGPILDGDRDVIISAATAAGKTEAAFLPICSRLVDVRDAAGSACDDPLAGFDPWQRPSAKPPGVEVLYVSPLKALINDQFDRLEFMCEQSSIPVHRWHGDVSSGSKRKLLDQPSGVLLITPESLEATFVNRGSQIPALMAGLRYVVVDEMHSFMSTARGAQLQSLLGRVELAIRRRPPRIGLSATLGDMSAAARFLRPSDPEQVLVVTSSAIGQEMRLQVRGVRDAAPEGQAPTYRGAATPDVDDASRMAITDHLFRTLRGADNLVFCNARADVEAYADALSRRSEAERVPNEFWAHHGSLAKDVREVVESHLKDRSRPVTAVCTSTLEMGIDIGSVSSVAQIGPPPSVASLRQRLGRSGRRGEPAVMRIYVSETDVDARSSIVDDLRCRLVQTIAMTRLLLEQWVEPPEDPGLNLSTLIQQILSVIAQRGGAKAAEIHRALCGAGPFERVDSSRFVRLLRTMAAAELVSQSSDGTLLHGPLGERMVNHYSFYTAFLTPEEWRLVADGSTLGTLPISYPLTEGSLLIFAGRRWQVTGIDSRAKVVELTHAAGGIPPKFGGGGAMIGDRIRAEMANVYGDADVPSWLNPTGKALLAEGREAWCRLELDTRVLVASGKSTTVLPWVGDHALVTVAFLLAEFELRASVEGPAILVVNASPEDVANTAKHLLSGPQPADMDIARRLENTELDKWDWVLSGDLAAEATAARLLDVPGAWKVIQRIADRSAESA